MDISLHQAAPAAVAHAAPAIHYVTKTVFQGVTYMEAAIASGISILTGFGIGWYVRGRGFAGVAIDIANIKNDIVNLKNKIDPPAATVVVPVPVVAPVVTPTA